MKQEKEGIIEKKKTLLKWEISLKPEENKIALVIKEYLQDPRFQAQDN